MADIVFKVPPIQIRMGPTGFIIYADDYLKAYNSFETDTPFSPAKYYLVCRSIELSLKSLLLVNNVPIKKIKRSLSHDLHKILRKTKELGIDGVVGITDEEKAEVEKANSWYKRKGFEYFSIENLVESKSTLPDLNIMHKLAERLIAVLTPICLNAE